MGQEYGEVKKGCGCKWGERGRGNGGILGGWLNELECGRLVDVGELDRVVSGARGECGRGGVGTRRRLGGGDVIDLAER